MKKDQIPKFLQPPLFPHFGTPNIFDFYVKNKKSVTKLVFGLSIGF